VLLAGWSASGCGAARDESAAADAGPDVRVEPPCDLAKPFRTPSPVKGLATSEAAEGSARFTVNERIAYFQRYGKQPDGSYATKLFVGIRDTPTEPSAELTIYPLPPPGVAEGGAFSTPNPSPDGKSFFFDRADLNTGLRTIFTAATSPPGVELVDVKQLPGPVNEGESQSQPYVVRSGAMYFVRDDAEGLYQLFRAIPSAAGYYGDVRKVGGLGPKAKQLDGSPVVTDDELTIYWASDRLGPRDVLHIYTATRPDTASSFADVRLVLELSTPGHAESPGHVSPDGCRLYFSSYVPGTPGGGDILVATKPK
jgi:hypothetical protein